VETLISVDFDESSVEQTDEIAEYLSAIDDVLAYYNENGQIKHVCIMFLQSEYLVLLPMIKKSVQCAFWSKLFQSISTQQFLRFVRKNRRS